MGKKALGGGNQGRHRGVFVIGGQEVPPSAWKGIPVTLQNRWLETKVRNTRKQQHHAAPMPSRPDEVRRPAQPLSGNPLEGNMPADPQVTKGRILDRKRSRSRAGFSPTERLMHT